MHEQSPNECEICVELCHQPVLENRSGADYVWPFNSLTDSSKKLHKQYKFINK